MDIAAVLATRELNILRLLAEGRTQHEIAHDLNLELTFLRRTLIRLEEKFGVHGRPGLVRLWAEYDAEQRRTGDNRDTPVDDPYPIVKSTLRIRIPPLLPAEEMLFELTQAVRATEFVYLAFALVLAQGRQSIALVSSIFRDQQATSILPLPNSVHYPVLRLADVAPLRVSGIRYGSPISVDLLGIGKALEVVRDCIKDLAWRAKHEKKLAELETEKQTHSVLKSKIETEAAALELIEKRLAIEKSSIEVAERQIEVLAKIREMSLQPEERRVLSLLVAPRLATLSDGSIGLSVKKPAALSLQKSSKNATRRKTRVAAAPDSSNPIFPAQHEGPTLKQSDRR